jgi:polyisoprenoid-binding protein YceI
MSTQSSTSDVAVIEGTPTVGTWALDPAHSTVAFSVRHMLSKVRGRFEEFSGTLTVVDPPEQSALEGAVKTASITTSNPQRDEHLRTSDFFDAATYPELTFRSTEIIKTGERDLKVTGTLTIKGTARPVTFDAEFLGLATDPWGNTRASFEARTTINREEWGLTWNQALETGGFVVGKDVKIEAELQFILQKG